MRPFMFWTERPHLESSLLFRLLLLLIFAADPVTAEAPNWADDKRIEEIRIVGNRRIPESTIRYYIQSREQDAYNKDLVLRDYRALLNTSFFEDARVELHQGEAGVIVVFQVKEKPLIRSVRREGVPV